eukprot:gb/GECH01003245.1/.p1 GENE.gb/GECH01003245.1/~~gb/GECH01003245.1/.p1  ORF type:complete len:811 (+),score=112.02 gb/GECH01003245.1/:1-2433(+)
MNTNYLLNRLGLQQFTNVWGAHFSINVTHLPFVSTNVDIFQHWFNLERNLARIQRRSHFREIGPGSLYASLSQCLEIDEGEVRQRIQDFVASNPQFQITGNHGGWPHAGHIAAAVTLFGELRIYVSEGACVTIRRRSNTGDDNDPLILGLIQGLQFCNVVDLGKPCNEVDIVDKRFFDPNSLTRFGTDFLNATQSLEELLHTSRSKEMRASYFRQTSAELIKPLRVAAIGRTGVGKSCILDKVLGEAIFPWAANATSYTAFKTKAAWKNSPKYHVTCHYRSRSNWNEKRSTLALLSQLQDPDKNAKDILQGVYGKLSKNFLSKAQKKEDIQEDDHHPFGKQVEKVFEERIEAYNFIKGMSQGEKTDSETKSKNKDQYLLDQITVEHDFDLARSGVELIDVPGIGDANWLKGNTAEDVMKGTDVILYFMSFDERAASSKAHRSMLRSIMLSNFGSKVRFVLNKADALEPNPDEEETYDSVINQYIRACRSQIQKMEKPDQKAKRQLLDQFRREQVFVTSKKTEYLSSISQLKQGLKNHAVLKEISLLRLHKQCMEFFENTIKEISSEPVPETKKLQVLDSFHRKAKELCDEVLHNLPLIDADSTYPNQFLQRVRDMHNQKLYAFMVRGGFWEEPDFHIDICANMIGEAQNSLAELASQLKGLEDELREVCQKIFKINDVPTGSATDFNMELAMQILNQASNQMYNEFMDETIELFKDDFVDGAVFKSPGHKIEMVENIENALNNHYPILADHCNEILQGHARRILDQFQFSVVNHVETHLERYVAKLEGNDLKRQIQEHRPPPLDTEKEKH